MRRATILRRHSYYPRVESLEGRLLPGDTVLGGLLAQVLGKPPQSASAPALVTEARIGGRGLETYGRAVQAVALVVGPAGPAGTTETVLSGPQRGRVTENVVAFSPAVVADDSLRLNTNLLDGLLGLDDGGLAGAAAASRPIQGKGLAGRSDSLASQAGSEGTSGASGTAPASGGHGAFEAPSLQPVSHGDVAPWWFPGKLALPAGPGAAPLMPEGPTAPYTPPTDDCDCDCSCSSSKGGIGGPSDSGIGSGDHGIGGGGHGPINRAQGAPSIPASLSFSKAPVRYFDGTVKLTTDDLPLSDLGTSWGHTRSWTNNVGYTGQFDTRFYLDPPQTFNGTGMVVSQFPFVETNNGYNQAIVVSSGTNARIFGPSSSRSPGDPYYPNFFIRDRLVYNVGSPTGTFVLTDSTGNRFTFYDFGVPQSLRARFGAFQKMTDHDGNLTSVMSYDTVYSRPQEVRRTTPAGVSPAITESYFYSYVDNPDPSVIQGGVISHITLQRQVGGQSPQIIRQVDYTYYQQGDSYGNAGDLKTATIKDANGAAIDTKYYRYYTSSDKYDGQGHLIGYEHGLKYLFDPQSYARLVGVVGANPFAATDAQVSPYADYYFQYDASQRVTQEVVQGSGCTACGGQGTFQYQYSTGGRGTGYNSWVYKTIEKFLDRSNLVYQNTVYTNFAGEVMLKIFHDQATGQDWMDKYQYEEDTGVIGTPGRLLLHANPSAVNAASFSESLPGLVNLNTSSGRIETTDYYPVTNIPPGGAPGYIQSTYLQQGGNGPAIKQSTLTYTSHQASPGNGGDIIYPVATSSVYRNEDGTGQETTSYSYTSWWNNAQGATNQIQAVTMNRPTVAAPTPPPDQGQNGPGTPDVDTTYFDIYGRPVWHRNSIAPPDAATADGYIDYTEYDQATGAVVKTIQDVDTTQTADFLNLPTGWMTPAGGGLHLKTGMQVDGLGRTTRRVTPDESANPNTGNVIYTVYDDLKHAVRTYPGWNNALHTPTGPTTLVQEVRPMPGSGLKLFTQTLTMSAAPQYGTTGNPPYTYPTGGEDVSAVQTLTRNITNAGGQVEEADAYFSLSGVTYDVIPYLGVENTNYYATRYFYDPQGRRFKTQMPTGTIMETDYDTLNRVVQTQIGTVGTTMTVVSQNVYDQATPGGPAGVGDSNLTGHTEYPSGIGSVADKRETDYLYDWRDRQTVAKQGVQTTEDTLTHRPIFYTQYDNRNEAVSSERYDGDTIPLGSLGSTNGVPNRPSAAKLRAKTTTAYDDQGRAFRTSMFSVDQTIGAVSLNSLNTNNWYDHRGNLIKTSQPGGLVTKTQYDGANRPVTVFTTNDVASPTWSDAGTVSANLVLTQTETTYDANGNALLMITRDRFHDETLTGALSDPNGGMTGNQPKARVSYVANYYDLADRLTDTVNFGTYGNAAFTRPPTVPTRSDTVLVTHTDYNAAGWVSQVTDPRALRTQTTYDLLQRVTQTVENFQGDGTPTDTTNRTTVYTYDGSGHVLTLTAKLPANVLQTTQYVYGVTTPASAVNSNDLLASTTYPANGQPNTETYAYNALGQMTTKTERNFHRIDALHTVSQTHAYTYDVLGRPTADAVTVLGDNVDNRVQRLQTAYDTGGRPYLFTSYDQPSGGNIVNQVQRTFNGLSQLTAEAQAHNGAVTMGTPTVQYAYSFNGLSGGANHSRPTSMTYPSGRVITDNYASGLDDAISRLTFLSDNTGTLESYSYLGLSTVVKRAHPQPGIDLTYIKQTGEMNGDAGDQYTGLDRFGRVVDQRWLPTANPQSPTDRFQYAYDRDGNRQYRNNLVNTAFGELYHASGAGNGYDGFNQLTVFGRGTLSASQTGGPLDTVAGTHNQSWSLDALGNWTTFTTDGTPQSRTHNLQNQITSLSPGTTPAYDANGNTTTDDQGSTYTYDAWNRLALASTSQGALQYSYDALSRRVSTAVGISTTDLYYSSAWQVIEEQVLGTMQAQYVWSPVYVDALIERDAGGQRLYAQQDANWNVTALVDTMGTVQERYAYDPYGKVTVLDPNTWAVRSGSSFGWVYLHQGGRYDTLTGLYNFRHRDYSPTLGRWMEVDPIGYSPRELDRYCYVKDNPVDMVDPKGLEGGSPFWSGAFGGSAVPPGPIQADMPPPAKKQSPWVIGEPVPGINTIVCDGKGGIKIQIGNAGNEQQSKCLKGCIEKHEETHKEDALAADKDVCKGVAAGRTVRAPNEAARKATEFKAYQAEIDCLKEAQKGCDPKCTDIIKDRIKQTEDLRDKHK